MFTSTDWSLIRAEPASNIGDNAGEVVSVRLRSAKKGSLFKVEVSFACWEAISKLRNRKRRPILEAFKEHRRRTAQEKADGDDKAKGFDADDSDSDDEVRGIAFGDHETVLRLQENELLFDSTAMRSGDSDRSRESASLPEDRLHIAEEGEKRTVEERGDAFWLVLHDESPATQRTDLRTEPAVSRDDERTPKREGEQSREEIADEQNENEEEGRGEEKLRSTVALSTLLHTILAVGASVEAEISNAMHPGDLPSFFGRKRPDKRRSRTAKSSIGAAPASRGESASPVSEHREDASSVDDHPGSPSKVDGTPAANNRPITAPMATRGRSRVGPPPVPPLLLPKSDISTVRRAEAYRKPTKRRPELRPELSLQSSARKEQEEAGRNIGADSGSLSRNLKTKVYFNGTPRKKKPSATEIRFSEKSLRLSVGGGPPPRDVTSSRKGETKESGGEEADTVKAEANDETVGKASEQSQEVSSAKHAERLSTQSASAQVSQRAYMPVGCRVENFETQIVYNHVPTQTR